MTTRAALYARVSLDKSDKTSCDQQLRNCREFATKHGMKVIAEYRDDFITGTDDERPGYLAMQLASEAGDFDALIADSPDRLSRNEWGVPKLVAILKFRDQLLVTVDGKIDSRNEHSGLMASLFGMIASEERKAARPRTKRGQRQRFEEGLSTGGKAFGYRSVPLFPGDPDNRRARKEIDPAPAGVVKRIFRNFASGDSYRTIAAALNAEGIASPGAAWDRQVRRKDAKWLGSAVRAILDNEIYAGHVIFDKYDWRKVPGKKTRVRRIRPESEWKRREAPELRIIEGALWTKVRARRAAQRAKAFPIEYSGQRGKVILGRGGRRHKYIFSGILKCEECGCSMVIADSKKYACGSHVGGNACGHDRRYERVHSENVLLNTIQSRLLTPERETRFRLKLQSILTAQSRVEASADPAARLAALDQQIARYVEAIGSGLLSPTLMAKLVEAEAEKATLLRTPARAAKPVRLAADAVGMYRSMLGELGTALGESPERAHGVLERWFGAIPVARTGNARLTLDGGKLVNLSPRESSGSGGRI